MFFKIDIDYTTALSAVAQQTNCSNLAIQTLQESVKYVQSYYDDTRRTSLTSSGVYIVNFEQIV